MIASSLLSVLAVLLPFGELVSAYTIVYGTVEPQNETSEFSSYELKRRDTTSDPTDFSWVRRWAAVGDSYTAGVGSGSLYSQRKEDVKCSRYDHSYAAIINEFLGGSVQNFQYLACTGDRSGDIIQQISALQGNLDLVMMTAGGNDLCLVSRIDLRARERLANHPQSSIIKKCIFLPFQSESSCQQVLDIAQSNVDNILKSNIAVLLDALNNKMNDHGVVVYNLYAQFFNADTDPCGDQSKQDWTMPAIIGHGLPLTKDRRAKFNTLAANANKVLKEVVDEYAAKSNIKYKITWSDWDTWVAEGVSGRMCQPESSGRYPDPNQKDLQFFKPSTYIDNTGHDELKRDISPAQALALAEAAKDPYKTSLWLDPNPNAEVLHRLDKRAPSPPGCPGDGGFDWTFGWGLPDRWLKYFHPNEPGHETISAFALETLVGLRSEVIGKSNPYCSIPKDKFTCWQKTGRRAYANPDRMNENYKDFCNTQVKPPSNTVGWKAEKTYHEGTPDEHSFLLQLSDQAGAFSKDDCLEHFSNIINGCDGNDPNNPMNWKFGGQKVKGEYTYEVNVKRDNRPWPPIKKPYGDCEGWYKVFYGNYKMHGAGWSTYDWGQQSLLPRIKGCLGLGVTAWKFEYYDQPDKNGNEWGASFNTPIWVRARCFNNNKVQFASGGFTNGCRGND